MALAKFNKLMEIIKANGGIFRSIIKLYFYDELKEGRLVGQDQFGNLYFENNRYFIGRNRWVEYNLNFKLEYDASLVPSDWHGWLHNITDYLPCEDPSKVYHSWILNHTENLTATKYAYYPYSTTKPKIEAWQPTKPCIPS